MRNFITIVEGDVIAFPSNLPTRPVDKLTALKGASVFAMKPRFDSLDEFTRGYIGAALWTEEEAIENDGGQARYENIDSKSLDDMIADCRNFQIGNADALGEYYDHGFDEVHAGHDFWLSRNGHGAGFWDRRAGEAGESLSEASKVMGEVSLTVGNDHTIYCE